MERSGLGGNPGMGSTVPREPKQVLDETLYHTIVVWDSECQLNAPGSSETQLVGLLQQLGEMQLVGLLRQSDLRGLFRLFVI